MDPDSLSIWLPALAALLFLLLTALAAAAETVLTSLNQVQLSSLINQGVSRSSAIESLMEDKHRSMAAFLVLNGLGLIGATSALTLLIRQLTRSGWVEFLLLFGLALLVITLAQIAPKAWAAGRPDQVADLVGVPIGLLIKILWPALSLFDLLARFITRIAGKEDTPENISLGMSEEELRLLVGATEEEGLIEEEEKEMIAGIFELGQTLAREVMVPRINIVAVEDTASLIEALDVIIEAGHSRIPVYHENIDNIVGVLYVKDLLPYLRDGETDIPLCDIVREPYFIPESKRLDDLLQELQQRKVHIAIVVDEYGGTAGLVTIEDLLEEIVGEIQDEYDQEESFIEYINENEVIFDARIDVDDVNRLLSLSLPTDHGDTLGGLIFGELGKIPSPGDRIAMDGVTLVVLSVVDRRIDKVRVIRQPSPEDPSAAVSADDEQKASDMIEDMVT